MVVTALQLSVNGKASDGEWYLPYVNVAVGAGIHRWSDFSSGDWNTPITRQEMSRMIVRATDKELQKPDASKSDTELMYLAAKAGLIQGLSGGQLGESEATTRAQSVTVIERILTINGGGKLEVDKHAVNRAELAWHKTNIFTVVPDLYKNISSGYPWNPDNLFVETPDGYRGELDALIAIDLDDPDDPNRFLLGDMNTLKWHNTSLSKGQPVSELQNVYVLYFKGREIYNNNPQVYRSTDYVPYNMTGFIHNQDDFKNGKMTSIAHVFQNKYLDTPAFVISKHAKVRVGFSVFIYAPALAGNKLYDKTLIASIME
jgi:hypothetical protein